MRSRRPPTCVLAVLAVLLPVAAPAAPGLPQWLDRLASEDFKVREEASEELVRRGRKEPAAVQRLCLDRFLNSPDPEIRLRCKAVLRELLVETAGFIGIYHQPREIIDDAGERRQGVEVVRLIRGEAAEKAGLQVGDVIVAIDGQRFNAAAPAEDFGRRIRQLGADRRIRLEIVHAGQTRDLALTTGTAPPDLLLEDPEARFREWLEAQRKAARPR